MKKLIAFLITVNIYYAEPADEYYPPINQENFYLTQPSTSEPTQAPMSYTKEQLRQSFAEHIATLDNSINILQQDMRKLKIQVAEQDKLIALLVKHTHGYFLTKSMGGAGPQTQTTAPLEISRNEILRRYQMDLVRTTKPNTKPIVQDQ